MCELSLRRINIYSDKGSNELEIDQNGLNDLGGIARWQLILGRTSLIVVPYFKEVLQSKYNSKNFRSLLRSTRFAGSPRFGCLWSNSVLLTSLGIQGNSSSVDFSRDVKNRENHFHM